MSVQTVDYLETFLAGINFKTFVTSYSNDGTSTTITVKEMFYARVGLNIDIDGTDYPITSVNYTTKTIIFTGVVAIPLVAELQAVQYFHGTPIAVNGELNAIPLTTDKAPFLYVYEIIPEDYDHSLTANLDRIASVKMVFLDDSSQYNTTDLHYSNVITPISNLVDKFVKDLLNDRGNTIRVLFERSRRLNHVMFGTYTDNKGHETTIFEDRLTGIELDIDIPFSRVNNCKITQPT